MYKRTEVKFIYYVGDFFNILKAFIGTNYQALPFAFHNSGILMGVIGVFFIATLTDHCCQLMVRCKYYAIDQIVQEEADKGQMSMLDLDELRTRLGKTLGYGDIGRTVFGDWCYHLIQGAVWFTQFTTCTCYFIFIGNTVMKMYPQVPALIPVSNSSYPINVSYEEATYPLHVGLGVPMLDIHNLGKRSLREHPLNSLESQLVNYQQFAANYSVQSQDISQESAREKSNVLFTSDNDNLLDISKLSFEDLSLLSPDNITTEAPNTTTVPADTTTTTEKLPTPPPSPEIHTVSTAPDLKWIVLFPLPFFIVTSLIRKVRLIAPFSFLATVALGIGAMSVFVWICVEFAQSMVDSSVNYWIQFSTLPLFIGQLIGAYEGIGCIIPIESSMEGNRWVFPMFLHVAVYTVFLILTSFGVFGYLTYGDHVEQLVVLNLPSGGVLSMFIDVTLIISVLFTYPLQCFPVIEITESYLFGPGNCNCCKSRKPRLEYDEIGGGGPTSINADDEQRGLLEDHPLEASTNSVSTFIPKKVPGWQRNLVRLLLTLAIMGLAVLCRNAYAYLGAFTGAVGCALLAYIIPCAVHLKVKHGNLSWKNLIKDWGTIIFSIFISLLTLVVIIVKIVEGDAI